MMAGRLISSCLRSNAFKIQVIQVARMSGHEREYDFTRKCGNREVVGYGLNGEASYLDIEMFPMPAVRFKPTTPDIAALKEKEKGDWKKLTIEEKKALYRASFCSTFAEMEAPTGEWKSIMGITLLLVTSALWVYIFFRNFVYEPLPASFKPENQLAQYERMIAIGINPITGISKGKTARIDDP